MTSYLFTIFSALFVVSCAMFWAKRSFLKGSDFRIAVVSLMLILAMTAVIGKLGVLADFSKQPPPFMGLIVGVLALAVVASLSPWGARLESQTTLRTLVGLQSFRVLPEILLDLAWRDGLAPIQMTFHGRNFDIVTAITAMVLWCLWPRLKSEKAWAWGHTFLGLGLLLNILTIAVLSAPTAFRVFMEEPANTFVTTFPYIWLPGIHVLMALILHGITLRKLLAPSRTE